MSFETLMDECRLIAIIRGIASAQVCDAMHALYNGGIRIAEITYDSTGKTPDTETAKMIKAASEEMRGKMMIGAGTVLSAKQVEYTKKSGGEFIISPHFDPKIVKKTKKLGMISIPAAMSVSEIVAAHNAHADYIKIFPANALGGEAFFKALRGPLPNIRLLAVSGIEPQMIPQYKKSGAYGFGIGSAIINSSLLGRGDYRQIEENAKLYSSLCHS